MEDSNPTTNSSVSQTEGSNQAADPSTSEIQTYTLEEVAEHDCEEDCWIVIDDKVYDVTPYLDFHPGGKRYILETAGTDATRGFYEWVHSDTARGLLPKYFVGMLKKERD